ncbi:MAG: alpha/beta hydrolase, partial [Acetobacteraceae bacterium]|nr:alpha/beta hydrolase [Acetobacteraceae bacterium]
GGFRVVSVDYRMPPDFPYPAAVNDAMAVYRATLKTTKPGNIGIFGTSAGGGLTLVVVLRAKAEHLPLPGAIAPGTPWSDLTDTGDSYRTNEYLDNFNPSYNGLLRAMALLYANGHDLKDPMLSPVYGDMQGFPPTLLNTGTRDLFLSNTVRVFRKLRDVGVDAELQVWEGQSHAEYYRDINAPETKRYEEELVRFFDRHLTNDENS